MWSKLKIFDLDLSFQEKKTIWKSNAWLPRNLQNRHGTIFLETPCRSGLVGLFWKIWSDFVFEFVFVFEGFFIFVVVFLFEVIFIFDFISILEFVFIFQVIFIIEVVSKFEIVLIFVDIVFKFELVLIFEDVIFLRSSSYWG